MIVNPNATKAHALKKWGSTDPPDPVLPRSMCYAFSYGTPVVSVVCMHASNLVLSTPQIYVPSLSKQYCFSPLPEGDSGSPVPYVYAIPLLHKS